MNPVTAWSVAENGNLYRCGRHGIAPTFFTSRRAAEGFVADLRKWGEGDFQVVRIEIREVAPLPGSEQV